MRYVFTCALATCNDAEHAALRSSLAIHTKTHTMTNQYCGLEYDHGLNAAQLGGVHLKVMLMCHIMRVWLSCVIVNLQA